MASKRRNMFHKKKRQETTEIGNLPSVTDGPNPECANASKSIGPVQTKHAGRAMTAKAPISTGETLVVEPAYAAVLLTDKYGTHCLHCFNRLKSAIPCPKCSGVAFCSVNCQECAWQSYHKWECPYTELQIGSGMSVLCYLALRIVTQINMLYLNKVKPHVLDHKAQCRNPYVNNMFRHLDAISTLERLRLIAVQLKRNFRRLLLLVLVEHVSPLGRYLQLERMRVHRLEGHTKEREPKDFLHRTLMALFLLRILKDSGYFGDNVNADSDKLSEDEIFVGGQLLRHMQVLQYNAHEIYETVMKSPNEFSTSKTCYIGIGLYPTVALFNHECYPAVTRYASNGGYTHSKSHR
ncbi:hypothetical protein AAG570_005274 [Ranatra chinensis]|uniref:MYND-type domain-containing protein n=1 Tax=Ranatra chinensis TaxID=642074 RepID=A0ABD0YLR3_9HEMI